VYHKNHNAFTLIEIVAAVIILTVIASLALVSFQKTMEKAYYSNARLNLISIHGASQIYLKKYGQLPVLDNLTLTQLNDTFDLNIQDNYFEYSGTGGGVNPGGVYAYRPDYDNLRYSFYVDVLQKISTSNPVCFGNCPCDG
jgi:prepilin-type N-terminal cleavage/methylation domain-containing protein